MQKRVWDDECRITLVCIDSYENRVFAGRLCNSSLPEGAAFQSLSGFLQKMEDLLDGMPVTKPPVTPQVFRPPEGRLATFALRVIFRQNASWQGSVTWLQHGREEHFRSTLELTFLLDSALQDAASESRKRAAASPLCTA